MPTNDDFDLASLFQGPGAVLAGVLGVADNARKTVGGVMETIASLQRAAGAVEALVTRMNRLVDDLELPLRALTPEVEKAVARMQRVSTALEGPVDRLIPGLEAAVGAFDRVALSQLPETVDEARQQLQALLDLFSELPRRLGLLGNRGGLAGLLPLNLLPTTATGRGRIAPVTQGRTSTRSQTNAPAAKKVKSVAKASTKSSTKKKAPPKKAASKAKATPSVRAGGRS